ncbi:MAG: hypothetical protein KOO66_06470 [Bacteroidales bacterium]|nr:hypothetical protein [Bacteroidales bacterium]
MNKTELISNLHQLVSLNVIGDKQLFNRYKGFYTELLFEEKISSFKNFENFSGGYMIPKTSNESSLRDSVYFTCIHIRSDLKRYEELYTILAEVGFAEMFLIKYDTNILNCKEVIKLENKTYSFPVPEFRIFAFNYKLLKFEYQSNDIEILSGLFKSKKIRNKNKHQINKETKNWLHNKLNDFCYEELFKIYVNRLIFDGYIGFSKYKGKPADIDYIIKKSDGKYKLLEIKEKDLPKRSKTGFGLDTGRLDDFRKMQNKTGLDYILIVRHINNQKDRELINWKYITVNDFNNDCKDEKPIQGGTGMRSVNSSNPTLICSLDKFGVL